MVRFCSKLFQRKCYHKASSQNKFISIFNSVEVSTKIDYTSVGRYFGTVTMYHRKKTKLRLWLSLTGWVITHSSFLRFAKWGGVFM